jgi:hypothetical protein
LGLISKELLFERTSKIRKIRKNGIRKKKMNFERTLFDQTTSSRISEASREDPVVFILKLFLQFFEASELFVKKLLKSQNFWHFHHSIQIKLKTKCLTATGIFLTSSTERGDQGELAAPWRLTEVHGLGASPLGVAGPVVPVVVVTSDADVVVAEGLAVVLEQLKPRSFDSGASEMTVVTSREKNSSIVFRKKWTVSVINLLGNLLVL